MGMGLMEAYFFFVGPTFIFSQSYSFCCSPIAVFSLSFFYLYSCTAVIGPSHSSGILRFIISTLLLFMDVRYRDLKLFVLSGLSLFCVACSFKPYQQLYSLIFNVLVPFWSSSLPNHLYFLGCDCRCPSSRPFNRWLGLAYLTFSSNCWNRVHFH